MRNDSVIVISGGSRGLGRELVSHYLEKGYRVATYSRKKSEFIDQILSGSEEIKQRFLWEQVDSSDFQSIESFTKKVFKRFGQINVLINNAGIGTEGILTLMTPQEISQLISVNLTGTILLTRSCSKYLLLDKGGAIINISSINGIRGHMGVSVYGATKAALDAFTRGLAKELGSRQIRVNAIAPGYLDTEMTQGLSDVQRSRIIRRTPLGRLGKVEDIVNVADFLLSPGAEFITGQTFIVDGGLTC